VTDEQLVAEIEAELARLDVADVLLHTASSVATLAYRGLREQPAELGEVQLAIDALQALLPLLENQLAEELRRDFRVAIADLQMGYAEAARRSV
jgi:hypothetical protein